MLVPAFFGLISPILMMKIPSISKKVSKIIIKIERIILLFGENDEQLLKKYSLKKRILNLFVNIRFELATVEHESQSLIIKRIISMFGRQINKNIIFVEGKSGSGKTTVILRLIYAIIHDKNLYEKYSNCMYYFNFGRNISCQKDLLRFLRTDSLSKKIVIIDDFQLVSKNSLKKLNRLYNERPIFNEAIIIILSQPLRYFKQFNVDASFIKDIKLTNCYMTLSQVSTHNLYIIKKHIEKAYCNLGLYEFQNEEIFLLHLYQLLTHYRSDNIIDRLISLINKPHENLIMLKMIAIISSLSLYKGEFSFHEFKSITKQYTKVKKERRAYKKLFLKLAKQKVFNIAFMGAGYYSFHERLANFYKKQLLSNSYFYRAFTQICHLLFLYYREKGDNLRAWLYLINTDFYEIKELKNTNSYWQIFEMALISNQYILMKNNLEKVILMEPQKEKIFSRDIAVLYEKCGEFQKATYYFNKYIRYHRERNLTQDESIFNYLFFLIELKHPAQRVEYLNHKKGLIKGKFIKVQANYWIVHCNIHKGIYDIDKMLSLLTDLYSNKREFELQNPYNYLHIARRAYFDVIRMYFLIGKTDLDFFSKLKILPISFYLRDSLPEFEGYYLKNFCGHYLHYEVLFEMVLLERKLSIDPEGEKEFYFDTEILSINNVQEISHHNIVEQSIKYYEHAKEELEIFGNKSFKNINLRINELKLILIDEYQAKTDIENQLEKIEMDYKYYFEYAKKGDIREFQANASLFLSKCSFFKAFYLGLDESRGTFDFYFKESLECLKNAIKFYETIGNTIGIARAKLLTIIISNYDTPELIKLELKDLITIFNKTGKEYRLIKVLQEKNRWNIRDLIKIIKYYPIVLQ